MQNHIEAFKNSMLTAGLTPPSDIIDDGKLHRFSTSHKKQDSAGWYVLHAAPIPAGCFGDWRKNILEKWCAKDKQEMSPSERVENLRLLAQAREQCQKIRAVQQQQAALKAKRLWASAVPAAPSHPYLVKKRIPAFCARQLGASLVLPIMNLDKDIQSLQFIRPDSNKRLLANGIKKGRFIIVNGQLNSGDFIICEGFATGASLALKYPNDCVIAAIDAGNLKMVATAIRTRYPYCRIVICADDDRLTPDNPGLTKAQEAADASGAILASPPWPYGAPQELTDYNDLMCWLAERGAE
ncbi:toprim domain-containing protein [Candidatus Berkiella aquae]|uniref:DNA primase TraC n=1 Tax=Candidatus Berkiella aquae TaxID=295108 RepID=A0A0Q9YLK7_9GAMM|nr:toprim domain-containing protein [Candidatus Berkiella aquae]MCS5711466.1 toprim domain-containing protein [Candidatus Berkiella aquae]